MPAGRSSSRARAGSSGSWLVRALLSAGANVVALVRDEDPQSEFVRSGDERRVTRVHGSLEDLAALERALVQYEVDVVFHLGAQTQVRHAQRQPLATIEANVRGTYNLLEAVRASRRRSARFVVASSDKAYGESATLPVHGGASARGPEHLRRVQERGRPAGVRPTARASTCRWGSPAAATSTAAAT